MTVSFAGAEVAGGVGCVRRERKRKSLARGGDGDEVGEKEGASRSGLCWTGMYRLSGSLSSRRGERGSGGGGAGGEGRAGG
jgi:hypothetical protein